MKFTVAKSKLSTALSSVRSAVPSRDIKPVLRNAKFHLNGKLTIQTTDLEVGASVSIPEVSGAGTLLLPFNQISQITSAARGDDISIEETSSGATVKCGNSEWNLPTEAAQDFPDLPEPKGEPTAVFDAANFGSALMCAVRGIGDQEYKGLALNCVFLEVTNDEICCVGTDSKVLSATMLKQKNAATASGLIPPKSAQAIAAICQEGNVNIHLADNDLCVSCGDSFVYTRLGAGRYVPWRKVFDAAGKPSISFNVRAGELADAVNRAAIACSGHKIDSLLTGMKFHFKTDLCSCSIQAGGSNGMDWFQVTNYKGKELEAKIGFDLLLSILKCVGTDEILTIELSASDKPMKLSTDNWSGLVFTQGENRA